MKRETGRDEQRYRRRGERFKATRRVVALLLGLAFFGLGLTGTTVGFLLGGVILLAFTGSESFLVIRATQAADAAALSALMSGNPCLAGEADATHYGVDRADLPEGQTWKYIARDFEDQLREAIAKALAGQGPRLVMLSGETKAGKTRAAFQALQHEDFRDASILVPRTGKDVEKLIQPRALPRRWKQVAIWLDDIESYATTLDPGTLRNLQCDRPIVLIATEGGRGARKHAGDSELVDPIERLRAIAELIEVPVTATARERQLTAEAYGEQFATETEALGLGRRMVAIAKLTQKLRLGHDEAHPVPCHEGVALMRAATDWHRTGAQTPLSAAQLDALYRHHLPNYLDPTPDLLESGIKWARAPLPGTDIALLRKTTDRDLYSPYDLSVQIASGIWPMPGDQTQEQVISLAGPEDCFHIGVAAYQRDDLTCAIVAFQRAEGSTDTKLAAFSAFDLGVALGRRGDTQGAENAYRRADQRGNAKAACNLGVLLGQRGDTRGAEDAWRRADQRGDAKAAYNLGVLLGKRDDARGAEEAFRRAQERGFRMPER